MTTTPTDFTPNLALPFLLPGQAQKHVTLNESLRAIDALLMGAVEAMADASPPADAADGQAWIVADTPTGAWSGHAGEIAVWQDGAWAFHTPLEGWRVWSKADGALVVYQADGWNLLTSGGAGERVDQFGIGTDADATNTLAAKLNAALFTAAGVGDGGTGDLRISFNKEAPGNALSLLLQTGYQGRAEIGLTDTDSFALRVSDDGASWKDTLKADHATGHIGVGVDPDPSDTLTVAGRLSVSGDDGSFTLRDNGTLEMSRANGGAVYLRTRSNGSDLYFGVTNSAGTLVNNAITVRGDQQDILLRFPPSPITAGAVDLGAANRAFRNVYLTNAPVIASDMRGKEEVEPFRQGLELINLLMPVSYVRAGEERYHFGLISQQVKRALDQAGLSGSAIWQLADASDPESAQSVSYTELIPALIDAVQELSMRIDDLERVAV